ncbi:protein canopy 4-like [Rhopilema esculentum]|uniref:protein canopy 4-like n=1 Tax=Rhopilema esculentum TaxID=499914 RepID=UPI0031D6FED6
MHYTRKDIIFAVLAFLTQIEISNCSEEFIIADGIKISKLQHGSSSNIGLPYEALLKLEERSIEYELEAAENKLERKGYPKKCHVCRLLVQELLKFLEQNGEIEEEREGKHPIFVKNGNVIYRVMQEVCSGMKNYRVTRTRHFRYIRGGSTPLREMFNDAQKDSRIKNWMYSVPESELDDPTGEIQRLQLKCEDLLVEEEDRVISWFFKAQTEDPIEWLCRKRVLKKGDPSCLDEGLEVRAEILERIEKKAKAQEKESSK